MWLYSDAGHHKRRKASGINLLLLHSLEYLQPVADVLMQRLLVTGVRIIVRGEVRRSAGKERTGLCSHRAVLVFLLRLDDGSEQGRSQHYEGDTAWQSSYYANSRYSVSRNE